MDIAHKESDKILEELEKELKKLYSSCYKKNKAEFEKALNKLLKNKKLTVQQQNELLEEMQRYEDIIKQLAEEIKNANVTASNMINGEMVNVYSTNYNYGAYMVENASGYNCSFNIYNQNAIKKLLADNINPFTMISLDEAKDKDIIYRLLKRQFAAAIINGETIEDIANRVKATTEKNMNDSIRIARTETTRISNLGRQDAFEYGESKGLKLSKKWISTADSRTRDRHLKMMNETVGLNEKFSNGLDYPGGLGGAASEVCNCRCTHIVEFNGVKKGTNELKLEEDLKNMAYNEWLKRQNKDS